MHLPWQSLPRIEGQLRQAVRRIDRRPGRARQQQRRSGGGHRPHDVEGGTQAGSRQHRPSPDDIA